MTHPSNRNRSNMVAGDHSHNFYNKFLYCPQHLNLYQRFERCFAQVLGQILAEGAVIEGTEDDEFAVVHVWAGD
jgi:hypothetical protein